MAHTCGADFLSQIDVPHVAECPDSQPAVQMYRCWSVRAAKILGEWEKEGWAAGEAFQNNTQK